MSPLPAHKRALLSLADVLLSVPRPFRIMIAAFLAFVATFATFPIINLIVSLITTITRDGTIYLDYLFAPSPLVANLLLFVSAGVGLAFYVVGWRYYVGTAGGRPPATLAVSLYFLIGVLAVAITSIWLIRGVITLSTPPI